MLKLHVGENGRFDWMSLFGFVLVLWKSELFLLVYSVILLSFILLCISRVCIICCSILVWLHFHPSGLSFSYLIVFCFLFFADILHIQKKRRPCGVFSLYMVLSWKIDIWGKHLTLSFVSLASDVYLIFLTLKMAYAEHHLGLQNTAMRGWETRYGLWSVCDHCSSCHSLCESMLKFAEQMNNQCWHAPFLLRSLAVILLVYICIALVLMKIALAKMM